jgi:hypothetical protein
MNLELQGKTVALYLILVPIVLKFLLGITFDDDLPTLPIDYPVLDLSSMTSWKLLGTSEKTSTIGKSSHYW